MALSGESAFTIQKSALPVALPDTMRIGAPLAKAPSAPSVPTPMPISALPAITACCVSPVPCVQSASTSMPYFA
jgi:hypothetical protein